MRGVVGARDLREGWAEGGGDKTHRGRRAERGEKRIHVGLTGDLFRTVVSLRRGAAGKPTPIGRGEGKKRVG